ncbi:hypothetical protein D4R87_00130 [bacterium]|nr:MAG: hypothetical protein D4R87_00130 [bacterium]
MNWDVEIAKRTQKQIKKFPKKDLHNIFSVVEDLKNDPYVGDIQKILGEENTWRKRVGSYRIIFKIVVKEKIIFVFDIRRRTTTTYKR